MSSREFVDTVTRDLLGSRVFVFTPRGEASILSLASAENEFCHKYLFIFLLIDKESSERGNSN